MELEKRKIKIFIISGHAESGKNVVASMIKDILKNKETIILAYAKYLKDYAKSISNWDGSEETKPRTLLQNLGVELIKNKIDANLLIRRMLEDIEVYSYFFDVIVISDARFIGEINCIKDKFEDVVTIKVNGKQNSLTEIEKNHITETALDNFSDYDYIIENYEDITSLKEKVDNIINNCL